eukprot:SAG31_NODE_200_length_20519_cov_57.688833_12_plen_83_part_00
MPELKVTKFMQISTMEIVSRVQTAAGNLDFSTNTVAGFGEPGAKALASALLARTATEMVRVSVLLCCQLTERNPFFHLLSVL